MFQYLVLGRASVGASGINKWMGSWMDGQTDGRKGGGREGGKDRREGGREKRGEIEWQLCEWNDG